MAKVYEFTFFLALGLLAIVVSIFVLAVSLLGRALEIAAVSESEKLIKRKDNNKEQMASIGKDVEAAKSSGQIPTGLIKKLERLEKIDRKFDIELGKIRKTPKLLTATWGVFYPSAFLIVAILLVGGAIYVSDINVQDFPRWTSTLLAAAPLGMWGLGLAAVGYVIYRICLSLIVIQGVAITSEETWIRKTVDAFVIAQKQIEKDKKPELELKFDKDFPITVAANTEAQITAEIRWVKGDIARNVKVFFFLPPSFSFVNCKSGPIMKGYVSAEFGKGDFMRPIYKRVVVRIKSPTNLGNYTGCYAVICEGFNSPQNEFSIVVK